MGNADQMSSGEIMLTDVLPFLNRLSTERVLGALDLAGAAGVEWTALPVALIDGDQTDPLSRRLASAALHTVMDDPLRVSVPAVERPEVEPLRQAEVSTRLWNVLRQHCDPLWGVVAGLSPAEVLAWNNAGMTTAEELLALAIRRGLRRAMEVGAWSDVTVVAAADGAGRSDQPDLLRALRTIAGWAVGERGSKSLLDAIREAAEGSAPEEVQESIDVIRHVDLRSLAGVFGDRYDVGLLLSQLRGRLDDRELEILEQRAFRLGKRPTLEELGVKSDVSRERIRQIETRGIDKIREALVLPELSPVVRRAHHIRLILGAAVKVDELAGHFAAASPSENANPSIGLQLWLAGPYELADDWVVFAPASSVLNSTRLLLRALTEDGWCEVDVAVARLSEIDVIHAPLAWIEYVGGYRVVDSSLVRWSGSLADKAAVLLGMSGEPKTADELSEQIPEPHSIRTLGNYLLSDPRFRRRGLKHYGLDVWGGEEYTKIADEIEDEIEKLGGEADLEYLVETLSSRFGVSPSSVRTYAAGHQFVRSATGAVRLRRPHEAVVVAERLELTKRCYLINDAWSWRVPVTLDVLRGSGTPMPPAFAVHIGLVPGSTQAVSSPWGETVVSWRSGIQPSIGSIRNAAAELRAAEGDHLIVRFSHSGGFDFSVLHGDRLNEEGQIRRAALLAGQRADGTDEEMLRSVGHAIGLSGRPWLDDIRARLRARREDDLVRLLPDDAATPGVDELLDMLGLGDDDGGAQ